MDSVNSSVEDSCRFSSATIPLVRLNHSIACNLHSFLCVNAQLHWRMSLKYVLLETDTFHAQYTALPYEVQKVMSADIMKLKDTPMKEPECEPLLGDFLGVWRIHVGRIDHVLYCVAYVVCEDCQERKLENQIGCLDCHKYSWYHVKLVLCGRRDEFYKDLESCWQSWILTANSLDQQE